jgi:pilus assembly protein FimV
VATKLALAKAYEEMGDHDQARELLEEVIAEGGEGDLAEQARQILGRLNA